MADTIIWIVAIERYGVTDGKARGPLDISEPIGVRAIEFAAQCATKDPQARIVLSISLPDTVQYRDLTACLPVNIKRTDATHAGLLAAISMLHGDGSLLAYWVGHGIMANDKRLVLCADSNGLDDLHAFEVDSLLKHLRSKTYPRVQIGFFDTCANVFPSPTVTALGGRGDTPTEQYFYFASSAAQVAPASTKRQGFSSIVIATLLDSSRNFPPTPGPLFIDLRRQFDEVRLSTRAFPLQWTEGSSESWSRQAGAHNEAVIQCARAARCSVAEFKHLRDAADGCASDEALAAAIREKQFNALLQELKNGGAEQIKVRLLSDAWERVQLAQSLESVCVGLGLPWAEWLELLDCIIALDNMRGVATPDGILDLLLITLAQERRERGWDSVIRLLALGARRVRASNAARADLVVSQLKRHPTIRSRVDAAIAKLPNVAGPAFLLIGLMCEGIEKSISVGGAWVFVNGERDVLWSFNHSEIPAVDKINQLIERAKARYWDRPLIIELLAPNDLLCSPREFLELVDLELDTRASLEEQNAFTLRWHNRMKGDSRYQPGTWVKRSLEIEKETLPSAALACAWADEKTDGHILAMPFPGPSLAAPQRNRGQFFTELKKGSPYMCWPRSDPSDLALFKQSVCELVAANDRAHSLLTPSFRVMHLAESLRKAKQAGSSDLKDLWLFVDEPSRNPYDWQYNEPLNPGDL